MPEFEALQRTLRAVQEDLKTQDQHRAEQNEKLDAQTKALTNVQAKLPNFATRWQLRLSVLGLVLVLILSALVVVAFRARDRAAVERQAESDRVNLIAGCGRSNDQRTTLRQVIEKAIVIQPTPDGLPSDLAELFRQGQERTARLRADLLALPGVQPVDCQAAFPTNPSKEKT